MRLPYSLRAVAANCLSLCVRRTRILTFSTSSSSRSCLRHSLPIFPLAPVRATLTDIKASFFSFYTVILARESYPVLTKPLHFSYIRLKPHPLTRRFPRTSRDGRRRCPRSRSESTPASRCPAVSVKRMKRLRRNVGNICLPANCAHAKAPKKLLPSRSVSFLSCMPDKNDERPPRREVFSSKCLRGSDGVTRGR